MKHFEWTELKEPALNYRPMVRWWWPGLDVDEDILLSQLDDLRDNGFAGAEIQAFLRGDTEYDPNSRALAARVHRYATPFYFDIVRKLMRKAKENGLLLELTAGSGYPLGDSCVIPEQNGMQGFVVGCVEVEGNGVQTVRIPDSKAAFNAVIGEERPSSYMSGKMVVWAMDYPRMRRDLKLVCVSIAKEVKRGEHFCRFPKESTILDKDSIRDVTGYVVDGELCYDFPEGDWLVFATYAGASYQRVKTDSRMNPDRESYAINHFASGVIQPYLDRHIGRGFLEDTYGNPFRAFFVDSFELMGPYFWTQNILTEFRKRRGYDVAPYLPFIVTGESGTDVNGNETVCFELTDDESIRIRHDYDLTLADVFVEYFMDEMQEWAHKNGLKNRVQCYGHPMDTLRAFGKADIPETEQLASAGLLDFLKLPASAALLYGKPLATAEAFVWVHCDYMETPLRMKTASDKLTIAGIGQLYYHGMPYLSDRYEWPGYFAWHDSFGSFINRNCLLWPWIKQLNYAIARNQYFVQNGLPVVDVCVYSGALKHEFPYTGAHYREELSDGELPGIDRAEQFDAIRFSKTSDRWKDMAARARDVGLTLMENGYDYAHINGERLRQAKLENGRLNIEFGSFKALIVPPLEFIESDDAEQLAALQAQGFLVLFVGSVPQKSAGYLSYRENDEKLRNQLKNAVVVELDDIANALKEMSILPGVDFMGEKGLQYSHRRFENAEGYFIRSSEYGLRSVTMRLPETNGKVYWCNPLNGELAPLKTKELNGWTELSLPFTHYGSHMVLFMEDTPSIGDGQAFDVLNACVTGECISVLNDDWTLSVTSAMKNEERTALRKHYTLTDWADDLELGSFTGWGVYTKQICFDEQPDSDLVLDLGVVGDIARISVNDSEPIELITLPYGARVGHLLHKGENTLRIEVLNCLRNGMINAKRFSVPHSKAMSGIIGPVRLVKSAE